MKNDDLIYWFKKQLCTVIYLKGKELDCYVDILASFIHDTCVNNGRFFQRIQKALGSHADESFIEQVVSHKRLANFRWNSPHLNVTIDSKNNPIYPAKKVKPKKFKPIVPTKIGDIVNEAFDELKFNLLNTGKQ